MNQSASVRGLGGDGVFAVTTVVVGIPRVVAPSSSVSVPTRARVAAAEVADIFEPVAFPGVGDGAPSAVLNLGESVVLVGEAEDGVTQVVGDAGAFVLGVVGEVDGDVVSVAVGGDATSRVVGDPVAYPVIPAPAGVGLLEEDGVKGVEGACASGAAAAFVDAAASVDGFDAVAQGVGNKA